MARSGRHRRTVRQRYLAGGLFLHAGRGEPGRHRARGGGRHRFRRDLLAGGPGPGGKAAAGRPLRRSRTQHHRVDGSSCCGADAPHQRHGRGCPRLCRRRHFPGDGNAQALVARREPAEHFPIGVAVHGPDRLPDLEGHWQPGALDLHGHIQVDLSRSRGPLGRELLPDRRPRRARRRGLPPDRRRDRGCGHASRQRPDRRGRRAAWTGGGNTRGRGAHRRSRWRHRNGRRARGGGKPADAHGLCVRHLGLHHVLDQRADFRARRVGALFLRHGSGPVAERGRAVRGGRGDRASGAYASRGSGGGAAGTGERWRRRRLAIARGGAERRSLERDQPHRRCACGARIHRQPFAFRGPRGAWRDRRPWHGQRHREPCRVLSRRHVWAWLWFAADREGAARQECADRRHRRQRRRGTERAGAPVARRHDGPGHRDGNFSGAGASRFRHPGRGRLGPPA